MNAMIYVFVQCNFPLILRQKKRERESKEKKDNKKKYFMLDITSFPS